MLRTISHKSALQECSSRVVPQECVTSVLQECRTRDLQEVTHTRVPQTLHTRAPRKSISHESVPQGCSTRTSHKSGRQECPTRVCPTRVSYKSVPQVYYKSVPQECPTRISDRVSYKNVSHKCRRVFDKSPSRKVSHKIGFGGNCVCVSPCCCKTCTQE